MRPLLFTTTLVALVALMMCCIGCGGSGTTGFGTATLEGTLLRYTYPSNLDVNFVTATLSSTDLSVPEFQVPLVPSLTSNQWTLDLSTVHRPGDNGTPGLPPPAFPAFEVDALYRVLSNPTLNGQGIFEVPGGQYNVTVVATVVQGGLNVDKPITEGPFTVELLAPGDQVQEQTVSRGSSVTYVVRLVNRSFKTDINSNYVGDLFTVKCNPAATGWGVTLVAYGTNQTSGSSQNITAAATSANGWTTPKNYLHDFTEIHVTVTPALTLATGSTNVTMISVTSAGDPNKQDTVWLQSTAQ